MNSGLSTLQGESLWYVAVCIAVSLRYKQCFKLGSRKHNIQSYLPPHPPFGWFKFPL